MNQPWSKRASIVEEQILADIVASMGASFHPKFFIPYVQLHEFEALAFANVDVLASAVAPLSDKTSEVLAAAFGEILEMAGHPEAIDDGYETCPSRRISGQVPAYKKRVHGPIVTSRIGIEVLRDRCDHFASWLMRLEQLEAGTD